MISYLFISTVVKSFLNEILGKILATKKLPSAGFHSRHFYSATIAVTAFGALGGGYAAPGEIATIEPGSVAS